jgi:hypothetical protein
MTELQGSREIIVILSSPTSVGWRISKEGFFNPLKK